ncbi:MAG: hypothetical protein ACRDDY_08480 [Clostridium sp.]
MKKDSVKSNLLDNLNNAVSNLIILMGDAIYKKEFNEAKDMQKG